MEIRQVVRAVTYYIKWLPNNFQKKSPSLVAFAIIILLYYYLLFVGRYLSYNQLKDLPKGVFDHNTGLRRL